MSRTGRLLVGAAVLLAACGTGPPAAAPGRLGPLAAEGRHAAHGALDPASATRGRPLGDPNADLTYRGAMFVVRCGFAHAAGDDPIVWPGRPGRSHRHDFFGHRGTDARATGARLAATGGTTCEHRGDTAAYWAPSLRRHGRALRPLGADAYYRVAPGVRPRTVRPYPVGLAMLAGDPFATRPPDRGVVAWGCGRGPAVSADMPACPPGRPLTLRVTFPDCWDGTRLDSPGHRAHVAHSGRRGCPASHPVPLARLTLVVWYPHTGPPDGLTLSSGGPHTAHADFLNGWQPAALAREVRCLRRGVVCSAPRPRPPDR